MVSLRSTIGYNLGCLQHPKEITVAIHAFTRHCFIPNQAHGILHLYLRYRLVWIGKEGYEPELNQKWLVVLNGILRATCGIRIHDLRFTNWGKNSSEEMHFGCDPDGIICSLSALFWQLLDLEKRILNQQSQRSELIKSRCPFQLPLNAFWSHFNGV